MSNKNRLRDNLQQENINNKKGVWHSKAYHRFFEGYSEITIPKPNGKGYRIQRIYTANYHRQDLSNVQQILLRILYIFIFLISVYMFVSSGIKPSASNSMWYVAIPQAVSIPFLFWIVISLFFYLPYGKDLTIHEYRSSSLALQNAALGSAIGFALITISQLIFVLLHFTGNPWGELLSAVKYLVAGFLLYVMKWIERKVNYLIIPNENSIPSEMNEGR